MTDYGTPKVGPLFIDQGIVDKEPEVIRDDNDSDPANEQRWLAFFAEHEGAIITAEQEFLSEYKRRRDIVTVGAK